MILQQLLTKVEELKAKTAQIRSENPGLAELQWHIHDVPVDVIQEAGKYYVCGSGIAHMFRGEGCFIHANSVPCAVRTVLESL